MTRLAALLLLACLASACRATLPPHVWLPVDHVEAVDFFWWTDAQRCQVRVIYWKQPDYPYGVTMDVDKSVCIERLKAEGYDIHTLAPSTPKEP